MTKKDPRVVIEKPFGHNLQSANHLQSVVSRHLRTEKQVYRIDHYLGKDTVNNILFWQYFTGTTLEQGVHEGGSDLCD